MSRINKRSGDIDFLSIAEGGTGASSMTAFKTNNNILPKNSPKAVILGPGGAFPTSAQFTGDIAGKPILTGSFEGIPNQTLTYTISNFDSFTNYTVSSTDGAISIVDDVITFVPGNNTSGNIYFTVNNNSYTVAISSLNPTAPTIQATGLKTGANAARINIQGTGFQSPANATMASMSVQISTTSDFAATIGTSNAGVNPTIDVVSAGVVYIRAKFIDSASRESAWSSVVTLNIASLSTSIATPTLTIVANKAASGAVFKVTGSAFSESSGKTHKSTVYQVAEDNAFASILFNETDPTNLINKTITIGSVKTTYYVRAKYISSSDGESQWSQAYSFNYVDMAEMLPSNEEASIYNNAYHTAPVLSKDGTRLLMPRQDSGKPRIFVRNGNAWQLEAEIGPSNSSSYGMVGAFNYAGDKVAISLNDYVYVYTRTGSSWTLFYSGYAGVSGPSISEISDDGMSVSVLGTDPSIADTRRVTVVFYNGTTSSYNLVATHTNYSSVYSIAASRNLDRIVTLLDTSTVRVYKKQGNSWINEGDISSVDSDRSGLYINSNGDTLGILFPGGALTIYKRSNNTWSLDATLPSLNAYYSNVVSFNDSGDIVFVGRDDQKFEIYAREGSSWVLKKSIANANLQSRPYLTINATGSRVAVWSNSTKMAYIYS